VSGWLEAEGCFLSFAGVPIASREKLIELIRMRPNEATEMVARGMKKYVDHYARAHRHEEGQIGAGAIVRPTSTR
jgi:hypothetical protein